MRNAKPITLEIKIARCRAELSAQYLRLSVLKLTQLLKKYDPDQPRAPAGNQDGGRWVSDGGNPDARKQKHTLKNPSDYIGQVYRNNKGHSECVEFAKQVGGAGPTKEWRQGDSISPEKPPPIGTWVATFVNGKYYGHVGTFAGYEGNGTLVLIDQYNSSGGVKRTEYHKKPANFSGKLVTIRRNITSYYGNITTINCSIRRHSQ